MVKIERLTDESAQNMLPELVALLQNCVDDGASIGFVPPLQAEVAQAYWTSRLSSLADGSTVGLVARVDEQVAGSVQLALEMRPNGDHRAEVQKLMVHTAFRRQGIASLLMDAIEAEARHLNRQLLVLDTRQGDTAEGLYRRRGYREAGVIPQYAKNADGSYSGTVFFYLPI